MLQNDSLYAIHAGSRFDRERIVGTIGLISMDPAVVASQYDVPGGLQVGTYLVETTARYRNESACQQLRLIPEL